AAVWWGAWTWGRGRSGRLRRLEAGRGSGRCRDRRGRQMKDRFGSSRGSSLGEPAVSEPFQALLEAVLLERLTPALAVVGARGIEPVVLLVDVQVDHFGQVRPLHQNLLFGNEPRNHVR